jgi:hypothetical protein
VSRIVEHAELIIDNGKLTTNSRFSSYQSSIINCQLSVVLVACLWLAGCGSPWIVPVDPPTTDQNNSSPTPIVVDVFDVAAGADALAKQAELANGSPVIKASELLDGILNFGGDAGIPADFAAKVRAVCPAIGAKPPGPIPADQLAALRAVR